MTFLELFWAFFKIGAFTFGGGLAMIPLMQGEVRAHEWLSDTEFINFVAVSESTPGPIAVNMATYVGCEVAGILGGICATTGVVLPSFLIILLIAKSYERFRENRLVKGALSGLKAAVIGLIASAVLSVGKTVFFHDVWSLAVFSGVELYLSVGIFLLATWLVFCKKKIHPIAVICLAAGIGVAVGYLFRLP